MAKTDVIGQNNKEEKPVKVNFREKKTYYATDKSSHYTPGQGVELHPLQAKDFLGRGLVIEEYVEYEGKPAQKEKGKKKAAEV